MAKKKRHSKRTGHSSPKDAKKTELGTHVKGSNSGGDISSPRDNHDGNERSGRGTIARAIVLLVLALGIGVSAYLTYGHLQLTFGSKSFESFCNISPTFNCDTVNSSDYSELFGLPIALFAIPTYLVVAFLVVVGRGEKRNSAMVFAAGISFLTVLASLVLGWISIFEVKAVCLFCITLYVVNVVTFVGTWRLSGVPLLSIPGAIVRELPRSAGLVVQAGVVVALGFAVALGAEKVTKDALLKEAMRVVEKEKPVGPSLPDVGLVDADDATFGPKDAKVTVVEFADFQCGYCKRLSYSMKSLKEEFGDRVLFVFKNFPMNPTCNSAVKHNRHRYACDAARAGVCANRQGKFWAFHDITFKNQRNLKKEHLLEYAREVGMDIPRFQQCMRDPSVGDVIARDVEASLPFKVTGTPRTIINGRVLRGVVPLSILRQVILKELGESVKVVEKNGGKDGDKYPEIDPSAQPSSISVQYGNLSFDIDTFEASRGPRGEAVSAFDRAPWNHVSWYEAKTACEAAGKRLCSLREWLSACQGAALIDDDHDGIYGDDLIEGNEFSYADYYDPALCNDRQKPDSGRVAYTGSFERCHTPTGIFDLNGNVQEWVGETEEDALLIGGHFYDGEKASCFRQQRTFGPGYANATTGFRCCRSR